MLIYKKVPENIMLDNNGKIHLLDFSIAKVITNVHFSLFIQMLFLILFHYFNKM